MSHTDVRLVSCWLHGSVLASGRRGRRRPPFRPRRGQARCAVDPARHRGEGGRDRTAVARRARRFATVVAPAGYGKTTLLAQWAEADPRPFAWVALDGRDDDDPSCSCGTSRPRFTGSSRSRPRCSTRCPARAGRPGRRASRVVGARWPLSSSPLVLVLDDLHARRQSGLFGRARGARSRTSRPARRSRSRAGKSRRCRLPAGGRRGGCTRSAWPTSGWTSRRPRCCWKLRESSSTRTSSPS